jgi:hypothetical protein
MEHAGFPSEETLAAFLDGDLDGETRRRVMQHLTVCDECYASFVSATEMRDAGTLGPPDPRLTKKWGRRSRTAWVVAVAAAVAAALAALVVVVPWRQWVRRDSGVASLVAAGGRSRAFESRLTAFPYRPFAPPPAMRGGQPAQNAENWKLLSAAALVQEEAKKHPTPENLHALGVSHLLFGNWDDAVALLQRAARDSDATAKRKAELLNDLAAAYLARGRWTGEPKDYAAASQTVAQAWALARTPEIAWNRALSAEGMKLPADAAWRDYLTLDATSPWAAEARQHLH